MTSPLTPPSPSVWIDRDRERPRAAPTAGERRLVEKLKCVVVGHAWRIDMDPRRACDVKLCIRCGRVEEC